jgi:prepilin-type N-terminal cleavage/methylation domain-containing protein/prepilin-type processing-associated H-X9-DG protein
MKAPHASRSHGYSLLELIVAMAVMVILFALVLGTINLARRKAKQAVCLQNLHQIAIAFRAYQAANNLRMPLAVVCGRGTLWIEALKPYVSSTDIFICPELTPTNYIYDTGTLPPAVVPGPPPGSSDPNPGVFGRRDASSALSFQAEKLRVVYPKLYLVVENVFGQGTWPNANLCSRGKYAIKVSVIGPNGEEVLVEDSWLHDGQPIVKGPYYNVCGADFTFHYQNPYFTPCSFYIGQPNPGEYYDGVCGNYWDDDARVRIGYSSSYWRRGPASTITQNLTPVQANTPALVEAEGANNPNNQNGVYIWNWQSSGDGETSKWRITQCLNHTDDSNDGWEANPSNGNNCEFTHLSGRTSGVYESELPGRSCPGDPDQDYGPDYNALMLDLYFNDDGVVGHVGVAANTGTLGVRNPDIDSYYACLSGNPDVFPKDGFPAYAVASSYGYNYLVGNSEAGPYRGDEISGRTIVLLDYRGRVVTWPTNGYTVSSVGASASIVNSPTFSWTRPPHLGDKINVLFMDGSAEAMRPETIPLSNWVPQGP